MPGDVSALYHGSKCNSRRQSSRLRSKTKADQEKLGAALQTLITEDPTIRVHSDAHTGQTIVGAMAELQLEIFESIVVSR
jgi:translation elongation factor EF-G